MEAQGGEASCLRSLAHMWRGQVPDHHTLAPLGQAAFQFQAQLWPCPTVPEPLQVLRGQLRREAETPARPLVLSAGDASGRGGYWPASVSSSVKWGCVISGHFRLWRLLWF